MPKEVFSLTIKVFDDGTTTLSGPLDNKTLCYGLLESAKDEVRKHQAQIEEKKSQQALQFDLSAAMVRAKQ